LERVDTPHPVAPTAAPVHPIVYLDYRIRTVGHAVMVVIMSSVFYERDAGVALWMALLAQGLLWPHVAFAISRASRNSRRAEYVHVLVDGFIAGGWIAQAAFSLWPSVAFALGLIIALLTIGGLPLALGGVAALAAGAGLMGLATGFTVEPEASRLTTGLSIAGIIVYCGVFALVIRRQARRIIDDRRTIERQTRELAEALERETATSEILHALSSAPTDARRVLDAVARDAARLCGASDAVVFRLEATLLRPVAGYGALPTPAVLPATRGTVTGRAVTERRPIHVHDLTAEAPGEYAEGNAYHRDLGLHTLLAVPLLREGVPTGAIMLRRSAVQPFTDRQVELSKIFADQAAIAIDNARLFEELEGKTHDLARSLDEVRALSEVGQAVSSSLDLTHVLSTIIRHAMQLSGADAGMVVEYSIASGSFVDLASANLSPTFLEGMRRTPVNTEQGVLRRAYESGQPFQIPDFELAPNFVVRDVSLREGLRALLAAPIPGDNLNRGVVVFRRAPGRFDERVVKLLVALSNQSKVAVDNARLFDEVRSQQRRLEELSGNMEQLYTLSTSLQEPLSLREQLHRVLEGASQMGLLDRIYIWAVSPEADRLVNLAGAGFAADEWKDFDGAEIPLAEAGVMFKAYLEGVPILYNEANPLPPELRLRPPYSEIRAIRTRSLLVAPMIARGVTVGVLAGDNKPSGRPILPHTVRLVQTFALHAAVAIANARLFQAIEEKNRQLETANRAKSQFVANMSHELRTPMNAILGYTELILDETYGELPEKIRGILDRVAKSGRHLLGLINDVLDLSKIEAGELTLNIAEYSMREVMHNVFMSVESLASDKQLELSFVVPPDLPSGRGDERRITQVLLNLVGNAIKFTDAGRIRVEGALDGDAFTVSVTDTGSGIAAGDQETIFEEFKQVDDSSTRKVGGTGLGLAIARRIITMHGGRLWVRSDLGQGSTFAFTVPRTVERRKRDLPVDVDRRQVP
jgi:signal transduction histidine kinase